MGNLSCSFHCLSAEMTPITLPIVCQLKLIPSRPLQGVWEMWGTHGYSMRIKYLPQCDHDDSNHLYCHPNHCASPSPTLWLHARHSALHSAQLSLFHCHSLHHKDEETEAQRAETVQSHRVSKGSGQDPARSMTAVPPVVPASHSSRQPSFCST